MMFAVRLAGAAFVGLVLAGCGSGEVGEPRVESAGASAEVRWSYTVPAGTGARIDSGESIDVLPADIDAEVGDVLRIVNEDDRGHVVGPFFVGPGETLTQRFASPGTYRGRCSVHSSGEVIITVRA